MSLSHTSIWFAIAAGGAIGSVLRFWVGSRVDRGLLVGPEMPFPVATLLVNVTGSFCIGLVFAGLGHMVQDLVWRETLRAFLMIGLLGGFTTLSAISLETVLLIENGLWGKALLNIIASAVLSIVAAFAGLALVRGLVSS